MSWRSPRLWIACLSTLAVLLVGIVDLERTAPGELSRVHGREDALSVRNACSECHGGWLASMTSACLECHELIETHIDEGRGLHGVLEAEQVQRCAECHSEHHGAGFMIVNLQSFKAAGVPDPEQFDHELIGFRMDGEHLELDCSECHEHAQAQELPLDAHRFLGLTRDCASCHEDSHDGAMAVACSSCHGQTAFEDLFSLGHEEHLPLLGGHAAASCRDCHAEGDAHSLEIVGSAGAKPPPRDCLACHDSPHAARFQDQVARQAGLAPGAGCVQCHETEHTAFDDPDLELTPAQHAASGFSLDTPHEEVDCDECHATTLESYVERFPGRAPEACHVCHEGPHEGQFERGSFARQECTACHADEHFDPPSFDTAQHERTQFPLTGSHVEVVCSACHEREDKDSARVFVGTLADCDACHLDAHDGSFDARSQALPAVEHGTCARCHGTDAFADVLEDSFEHELWTGFAAAGAHAQAACEACHERSAEPDDRGRRFGRVEQLFGAYESCATCHDDPHDGFFDQPDLLEDAFGDTGCTRCHVEVSFRSFPRAFEHEHWTGFALVGAHNGVACSGCHAPLDLSAAHGRSWERAAGGTCADCHEDPHQGQFETDGATDCARCHRDSGVFRELSFSHEWDARFRLGAAHAELSCSACHLAASINGGEAVRYRPLPRECVDCHGLRKGSLLRRRGKKN